MVQLEREKAVMLSRSGAGYWIHPWSRAGSIMQAVKGLFMEKWLCWGSMGVAGLLLLLFVLDMFLEFPFRGISKTVDVLSIIACGIVFYLAWDASRDLR
jgi:hypothetical protein